MGEGLMSQSFYSHARLYDLMFPAAGPAVDFYRDYADSGMLSEAQCKANERGVAVEWVQGDMRSFDLGRTFDFVFITAVRRHLAPGGRFVFDVFSPSVRLLADADGVRR